MRKITLYLALLLATTTSCGNEEESNKTENSDTENTTSETDNNEKTPKEFNQELIALSEAHKQKVSDFYTLCRSVTAKFMSEGEVDDAGIDEAVAAYAEAHENQREYIQKLSAMTEVDPDLNVLELTVTAEKNFLVVIETFNAMVVAMDEDKLDQIKSMYINAFPVTSNYQESMKPLAEAMKKFEEKHLK